MHRDGRVVIDDADIKVEPGERVLLGGESGSGKSTLIRAIAGLWPWGEGRILLPAGAKLAFVPQRPYIPLGTLRDAIAYPVEGELLADERAKAVLKDVGLGYLAGKLDDEEERWDQTLSGGERQRVAFARLLIDEPNIIIMDEATAALDIDSEFRLLTLLFERLPKATIFSVGHRPGLQELHSRLLTLQRRPGGGRIVQTKTRDRDAWKRLKGAAVRILRRPPGKADKDKEVAGKAPGGGAGVSDVIPEFRDSEVSGTQGREFYVGCEPWVPALSNALGRYDNLRHGRLHEQIGWQVAVILTAFSPHTKS